MSAGRPSADATFRGRGSRANRNGEASDLAAAGKQAFQIKLDCDNDKSGLGLARILLVSNGEPASNMARVLFRINVRLGRHGVEHRG